MRTLHRRVHAAAMKDGGRVRIAIPFRCDAPDVQREMVLLLQPLRSGGRVVGVLYHAATLRSTPRLNARSDGAEARDDSPLVVLCAHCKRVQASGDWLTIEDYYRSGGRTDADISHGICGECMETTLAQLAEVTTRADTAVPAARPT